MAFDPARYDAEVIRPLRGTHGRLPAGDLWGRYAIEPEMDAGQLARHLSSMRALWRERANGPDSRAEVCRLLLVMDEELSRTAGEAMNDPAWWREQSGRLAISDRPAGLRGQPTSGQPTSGQPTADRADAGQTVPDQATPGRVAGAGSAAQGRVGGRLRPDPNAAAASTAGVPGGAARAPQWQAAARALVRDQISRAGDTGRDRPPAGPGGAPGQPMGPGVAPEKQPGYVTDLSIDPVGASGDYCRVDVSWPPVPLGEVRVRWAAQPPVWDTGAEIELATMAGYGQEIGGTANPAGDRVVLTAEVPPGYLIYVPFVIRGERAVVGRLVGRSVAGPVRRLRIERRDDDALLSWIWPPESTTAVVEWTSGGRTETRQVSLADFTEANGCLIRQARAGGTARVWAITNVGYDKVKSPIRTVTVAPRPVRIAYTLTRRGSWSPFRPARLLVGVNADGDCAELVVDVVLSRGRVLPLTVDRGEVIGHFEAVTLRRGEDRVFPVDLPPVARRQRPYWIRCFVRGATPVAVVDPPVDAMKVT